MKDDKPSQTAVWIVKGLIYLNRDPRSIAFLKECMNAIDKKWLHLLSYKVYRFWFGLIEKMTIPGIFVHYYYRKQLIEKWFNNAVLNKCQQVIVLAAGFDMLTHLYYSKYPDIKFIEIDHPATQNIKKQVFEKLNAKPANVVFISCDLTKTTLQAVLKNHSAIDPSLHTFFVAEGITMYFQEADLKRLFKDIHAFFKNKMELAFTFMQEQPNGSIQFKNATFLVNLWLRIQNENFKWGIKKSEIAEFLKTLGYEQEALENTASEFKNEIIAEGEMVCKAKN